MDLPQDILSVIIGLGVLIGAIQCFFGYRIFKVILGLTGFLIGGAVGGLFGYGIALMEVGSTQFFSTYVFALLGGLLGALALVMYYFVGVFLIGAILGGVLGTVFFAVAESNPEPAILLILAAIAGVIALILQKFMIIVSTGFGGAWSVVAGIAYFTTGAIDPTNMERMFRSGGSQLYAFLLCWLALGIVGVIVQYKSLLTVQYKSLLTKKEKAQPEAGHVSSQAAPSASPDEPSA